MSLHRVLLFPFLAFAMLNLACMRSYNASPLSSVALGAPVQSPEGLEVKTHAFLKPVEIEEKFGQHLAKDTQVLAVQVSLANKGTAAYKVFRSGFKLKGQKDARVSALSTEAAIRQGREPWEYALLLGIFGIPASITGYQANEKLEVDYKAKLLPEELLEPGKELSGVLFFDPLTQGLNRLDAFTLHIELEDATTHGKTRLEQALH